VKTKAVKGTSLQQKQWLWAFKNLMETYGGEAVPNEFPNDYSQTLRYEFTTKAGRLTLCGDVPTAKSGCTMASVFGRFENPEAANKLLPPNCGHASMVGKWNLHIEGWDWTANPESSLAPVALGLAAVCY
jgi:hypothetical protein